MGNVVTCVDIDAERLPGCVPGRSRSTSRAAAMVLRNTEEGRLRFATDLGDCLVDVQVVFIAVGTPPGADGSADLSHVLAVARAIGAQFNDYKLVVTKSTVPVGTADQVRRVMQEELTRRGAAIEFDVVSNPEFLKEGRPSKIS